LNQCFKLHLHPHDNEENWRQDDLQRSDQLFDCRAIIPWQILEEPFVQYYARGKRTNDRCESDELATNCGFQEMPSWNTNQASLELLKSEERMLLIGWQIMNCSQKDGLNQTGNTTSINGV